MEESLYKVGSGETCYYSVYDDDGEYYGDCMMDTLEMLYCILDDFLTDLSENN